MAKISPCFKKTFVFFNSLFAIFGIALFGFGLFLQHFVKEAIGLYAAITLYVIGAIIFSFAVLGAYAAHKESKCALIVFFILMCLSTAGMLRIAIPIALSREEIRSSIREHTAHIRLNKDNEAMLSSLQENFHCCGILNGYSDWSNDVPASCDCKKEYQDTNQCVIMSSSVRYKTFLMDVINEHKNRSVWSQPCLSLFIQLMDKVINIVMAVFFSLAALAILGGIMSLAMIIRVSSLAPSLISSLPLSYQPPKYSEIINY